MWHLFEIGETVIVGLPDADMAADKWREDLRPAIERSRYRDLLPTKGGGSRDGDSLAIRFRHGRTLRFMTGGGGDKSRSAFTARVLVVTEADGLDEAGGGSREADKLSQLEARTRAYGDRRVIYQECTVSVDVGATWRGYTRGSASRIATPCPHCGSFVTLEREHFVGWQDAEDEFAAAEAGRFACYECGVVWSDEDRRAANVGSVLVHKGQSIGEDGSVVGEAPRTRTLGFRWSAVNNLFAASSAIASDEWRAAKADDEDNAEKMMRQFVWALPHVPDRADVAPLEVRDICRRSSGLARGVVPEWAAFLTVGLDLGKWLCHWSAIAWSSDGRGAVIDYGRAEVASEELGAERGVLVCLRELRDTFLAGWSDAAGKAWKPHQVWVDAGYLTDVVYAFARESVEPAGVRFRPAVGRGHSQVRAQSYRRPKTTGSIVRHIGEDYHISRVKDARVDLVEVNADAWKSWLHERLSTPPTEPGALTLFDSEWNDHLSWAKHVTAEKRVEEFVAGKGFATRWIRERKNNHWFDATYNAAAAAHFCGVRLVEEDATPKAKPVTLVRRRPADDVDDRFANFGRWDR